MGSIPHSSKYDSMNKKTAQSNKPVNKNSDSSSSKIYQSNNDSMNKNTAQSNKPVNKNSDSSSSKIYQSNNDDSFANKFKIENREDFIAKSVIVGAIFGGVIGALIGSENEIAIGAIIGAITIGSISLYIANKKK